MDQHHIHIELAIEGGPGPLRVWKLLGREAMNELSRFEVEVQSTEDDLGFGPFELEAQLGRAATLVLIDPQEQSERQIPLVVSEVEWLGEHPSNGHHVALVLESRQHVAAIRRNSALWVDETLVDVVNAMCEAMALGAPELTWRTEGLYPTTPQITQRGETDWAFLLRVLADEGVSAWCDDDAGEARWVLGDSKHAYRPIEGPTQIPLGASHQVRFFSEFEYEVAAGTSRVFLRDENVRNPSALIEGQLGEGPGLHFEYPARLVDAEHAAQRAERRLQQVRRDVALGRGTSDCIRLQVGRTFELDADDPELDGQYAVIALEHAFRFESEASASGHYQNHLTVVPSEVFYRPAVPAWVAIHGSEPATVSGPGGEEIHTNDLGDVKLKFPWDRTETVDDTTSTWARAMQPNLAGAMFIPRMEWEVLLAYHHGNPDRPCVLGRLYNAEAALPYSSAAEASSTSFQTATTPGGGPVNEIKLSDTAGQESMSITCSRDFEDTTGGNASITVAGNQTHTVALSLTANHASQSVTVGGLQDVNVGTDYTINVGGRTESIGGSENLGITGDSVIQTGAFTETVGGLQATQCVEATLECAALVDAVGGAMVHVAGIGANETVLGMRQHLVGAVRALQCANYEEKVLGAKAITSGGSLLQAGGPNGTTCASGSLTAASINASASAVVVFEAATIDITAAKIDTPGGTIGGGTLKVKGSEVKGTIKRLAETKLGS